eukprot:gene8704-8885_t
MKKKKIMPKAVAAKQQPPKPNPFELKGSKRKFDVVGKRDKDGKKNIIKQREEAVEKRRKTLLVEYKQLRKANTFIDRRFGEDDVRLDEEDKALARFQAHRIKEAKKAARFQLSGDAGDAAQEGSRGADRLTHGGRSLEELEELNSRPVELLGDLDEDLLEEIVQQYHFGGGGGGEDDEGGRSSGRHSAADEGGLPQQRKTKQQIIAKSKAAKAERARQKEADEAALEQLDSTFKTLVQNPRGLGNLVKPPGFDKGRKLAADSEADAAYDRAARELVFEAKGQAGERTLTREELEEREALRLAALEAARLKRMRQDKGEEGAEGEEDEEAQEPALQQQGGYAARRARLAREAALADGEQQQQKKRRLDASGDALDENFALSDEDDEADEGSSDDEDADAAPMAAPSNALEARRQAAAAGNHPLQKAFRQAAAKLAAKYGQQRPAAAAQLDGPLDLSFTPAVPDSYQEFAQLVEGRPPEQLQLAIQRIRGFNAAALVAESKHKMQARVVEQVAQVAHSLEDALVLVLVVHSEARTLWVMLSAAEVC